MIDATGKRKGASAGSTANVMFIRELLALEIGNVEYV